MSGLEPGPPGTPEPYGLDDLVRHEKRQMGLVALLLVGAVVLTVGRRLGGPADGPAGGVPPAGAAPVGSPR